MNSVVHVVYIRTCTCTLYIFTFVVRLLCIPKESDHSCDCPDNITEPGEDFYDTYMCFGARYMISCRYTCTYMNVYTWNIVIIIPVNLRLQYLGLSGQRKF